jgi:hypothetical protein
LTPLLLLLLLLLARPEPLVVLPPLVPAALAQVLVYVSGRYMSASGDAASKHWQCSCCRTTQARRSPYARSCQQASCPLNTRDTKAIVPRCWLLLPGC